MNPTNERNLRGRLPQNTPNYIPIVPRLPPPRSQMQFVPVANAGGPWFAAPFCYPPASPTSFFAFNNTAIGASIWPYAIGNTIPTNFSFPAFLPKANNVADELASASMPNLRNKATSRNKISKGAHAVQTTCHNSETTAITTSTNLDPSLYLLTEQSVSSLQNSVATYSHKRVRKTTNDEQSTQTNDNNKLVEDDFQPKTPLPQLSIEHSTTVLVKEKLSKIVNLSQRNNNISLTPSFTSLTASKLEVESDDKQKSDMEQIVVGDYSNPLERSHSKMRDAIDLYRYLSLTDRYGFCKRPIHRSFLLRNLRYMQRKRRKFTDRHSDENENAKKLTTHLINNALHSRNLPQRYFTELGEPTSELMATGVKFNFIRNNLCFGDRSAIVQCFHVAEIDCQLDPMISRIPSATFAMKVNEKLLHISIDLPDSFGIGFSLGHKSRAEHFIVKVVFRYEDAEVGGGKRLRKMPSRGKNDEKTARTQRKSDEKLLETSNHSLAVSDTKAEEVVMFGTKQIVGYSKESGLSVLHGETSIVLYSSNELNISNPNSNNWMRNTAFLAHIQRLQRKNFDNPFMSVQVLNAGDDEDDDEEDDDDEGGPSGDELDDVYSRKRRVVESCLNGLADGPTAAFQRSVLVPSKQPLAQHKSQKNVARGGRTTSKAKQKEASLATNTRPKRGRKPVCDSDNAKESVNNSTAIITENNKNTDDAKDNQTEPRMTGSPAVSADHFNSNDVFTGTRVELPEKIVFKFTLDQQEYERKESTLNNRFFGLATSSSILSSTTTNVHDISHQKTLDLKNSDNACTSIESNGMRHANECEDTRDKIGSVKNEFCFEDFLNNNNHNDDLRDDRQHDVFGLESDVWPDDWKPDIGACSDSSPIRILNTSHLCFFCLNQLVFQSLNALIMHLRLCHLRLKFVYQESIPVSKTLSLPGFVVSLNSNFDPSCEINPIRHYVKYETANRSGKAPRRIAVLVDPLWIVTRPFARSVRQNWMSVNKTVKDSELYNSTLFKDALMGCEFRLGARYTFEPPTKINHQWMIQANSRKLGEITDLHPCERAIMQMWNEFLLDIRITLLGRNMVYKASRVFVEKFRHAINKNELRIHFLLHLVNLSTLGCIDEDERYDLFRRLDEDYNPLQDDVHFVSRHLESLNRDRVRHSFKRGGELVTSHHRTGSASNLQLLADRGTPESGGGSAPPENNCTKVGGNIPSSFESLENLRTAFPTASLRRLEKLWRFLDTYTLDSFKMI